MRLQILIIFSIAAVITILLRVMPFLIFRKKKVPGYISYLGGVLPLAIYYILVIYNLRGTNFSESPFGIPEISGVIIGAVIQYLSKNSILSLIFATGTYMVLLRIM